MAAAMATTPSTPAFLAKPTNPATPESGAGCGEGSGDVGTPPSVLLPGVMVPLLAVAEGAAMVGEGAESVAVGDAVSAEVLMARSTPASLQYPLVNSIVPVENRISLLLLVLFAK